MRDSRDGRDPLRRDSCDPLMLDGLYIRDGCDGRDPLSRDGLDSLMRNGRDGSDGLRRDGRDPLNHRNHENSVIVSSTVTESLQSRGKSPHSQERSHALGGCDPQGRSDYPIYSGGQIAENPVTMKS